MPQAENSAPVEVYRLVNEIADDGHSVVEGCPLQGVVSHFVRLIQKAGIRFYCLSKVLIAAICTGCAHTLHWWCRARAARTTAGKLSHAS